MAKLALILVSVLLMVLFAEAARHHHRGLYPRYRQQFTHGLQRVHLGRLLRAHHPRVRYHHPIIPRVHVIHKRHHHESEELPEDLRHQFEANLMVQKYGAESPLVKDFNERYLIHKQYKDAITSAKQDYLAKLLNEKYGLADNNVKEEKILDHVTTLPLEKHSGEDLVEQLPVEHALEE